ncbi:hypothetical protein Trco_007356 [Trichoderma cornu-damae]|uniref:Zn(2)-C6 fungal-type domain-containing protein n=1 Tax=Trichoderma cornu-damae TaxID=654480 RepID=A0A9P8QFN6_9HYPO|nr:hypothetical protein Trco_007356 [Trichoderma cornu-damae]
MPISRKKTCSQCRRAKARCSLALPRCARCVDKSLECDYTMARMAPYPAVAAQPGEDVRGAPAELRAPAAGHGHQHGQGLPLGCFLVEEVGVASWSSSSLPLSSVAPEMVSCASCSDQWPPLTLAADPGADASGATASIDACHDVFNAITAVNATGGHPATSGTADGRDARPRSPVAGAGTQPDFAVHDRTSRVLSRRRGLTAAAVLSTRTILGQACSYPAMMVGGHSLPPFIHSRCALDDGLTFDCARAQKHGCLGKALSICASLVGMWLERTPASSPFIWETIYNEVARMQKEHESYDSETMLEAVQAITIYLLLQARDKEALAKNHVKLLLVTLGEIGQKLHESLEYNTFVDTLENPLDRSTWVLYEGARRTLSLLFIIDMFLEFNLSHHDSRCRQGFAVSPLPCIRELWEVPSTYEWSRRYSAFLRGRAVSKILTLADYKLSQHLSADDLLNGSSSAGGGCVGIIKDVMRWCEGMDQFGTLIALVATLIRYELGPSATGGNGYVDIA